MITLDLANACFELVGACFMWNNVRRLIRDRTVRGVYWPAQGFWAAWGVFNLVYYHGVGHPLSFWAGALLCLANLTWTVLAAKFETCYSRKE